MDSTTLNLLTRDGIVTVLIVPAIDPDQYGELHDIVHAAETADDLKKSIQEACARWGQTVHFG